MRLALWRMDSKAAPIIARENSRPYFVYSAFYPVDDAGAVESVGSQRQVQRVVQSPVTQAPENVLLHFEIGAGGEMRSPQVADAAARNGGSRESGTAPLETAAERRLAEFREKAGAAVLARVVALSADDERVAFEAPSVAQASGTRAAAPVQAMPIQAEPGRQARPEQQMRVSKAQQVIDQQAARNAEEFEQRATNVSFQNSQVLPDALANSAIVGSSNVRMTVMRPAWLGGMLVLARRVVVGRETKVQGCWLDWPGIRQWLLADVRTLLPDADLVPVTEAADADGARMLAALPVRLVPGPMPPASDTASPVMMSLIFAWVSILVAAGAVGALLYGAVALSERRAAFVSAVTHELRSPLTTFRLYADLLAGGMVADEERRAEYYRTLCREAERLSHLVENVLAYSKLERGRPGGRVEEIALGDLVERCLERLRNRCDSAGMSLTLGTGAAAAACVRADASAAEQVLFNLVDNACKYASAGDDKRIIITGAVASGRAAVTVTDFGPGLSGEAAARLFRPFSKSARDAAASAPGVGLGLALSRELARRMGGDLGYSSGEGRGAAFTLTLPVADGPEAR